MNKQEIFETVARHLFKQGEPALGTAGSCDPMCVYRTIDGSKKCAFGVLMTDEMYSPHFEGKDAWGLLNDTPNGYKATTIEEQTKLFNLRTAFVKHKGLISELQDVHDSDNWSVTPDMREALQSVADTYNLDSNFLRNLRFEGR